MHEAQQQTETPITIAAVERDTGLSKDTLRVWERRYGFPRPGRDANGERIYPSAQMDKLRLIARLLNAGHRPGQVVPLEAFELQQLVQGAALQSSRSSPFEDDLRVCLDLIKSHDLQQLRRWMGQAALRLGLARFVIELVSPLNTLIGEAWMRSEIQIYEEHMYTECVTSVLRIAINSIPESSGPGQPRVLLTTFSQEPHGLGLLMAETLLTLEGCRCISLGVQTPTSDIVMAATVNRSDIVALSFSASFKTHRVFRSLQELREQLPPNIRIWAGGGNPALRRLSMPGLDLVPGLEQIKPMLAQWRAVHTTQTPASASA